MFLPSALCVLLLQTARDSPLIEAVRGRQHPAGVNQHSSALVMVLLVSRLVHVDERLPRLLGDVALPTPEHAEHGPIQRVVQPLTARRCRRNDNDNND